MVDSQLPRQFASRPMRRPIGGTFAGPRQNPGFQFRGTLFHGSTWVSSIKAGKSLLPKPLLPAADVIAVAPQSLTDLEVGLALGQHQDQTSPTDIFGRESSGAESYFQFSIFGSGQVQDMFFHAPSLLQPNTNFNVT